MRARNETINGYFYALDHAGGKKSDLSSDEEDEEAEDFIEATNMKDVAEGGSFITASILRLSTGFWVFPSPCFFLKKKKKKKQLKVFFRLLTFQFGVVKPFAILCSS